MTTGKTIALTRQTFVGKVMSILLNMLSRLVITFLPRSKHILISWLQSPSAVILWLSWKRIRLQWGRPGFDPWVGKIPWRRERLPTPVFWPGEFHGPVRGVHKELDTTERHRHREQIYKYKRGKGKYGMNWEIEIHIYILLILCMK